MLTTGTPKAGDLEVTRWSVYFDDSGTHAQSEIAVAACYIAPAVQIAKFESSWNALKEQAGFNVFHMAEFVARRGEFKGWEDPKRDRVIRRLIGVIRRHTTAGIAVAVPKLDYDAVIPPDLKAKLGNHHYAWCVKMCFGEIEKWRQRSLVVDSMTYIFEQGTRGATGELLRDLTKYAKTQDDASLRYGLTKGGFSFKGADAVVQLQAADILAWETYHRMRNSAFATNPKQPRRSYLELRRNDHAQVFFIKRHQLEKWVCQTRELEALGESAFSI